MFQRLMNYADIDPKPNVPLTPDVIRKNMPRYKRHDDMIVVQEDPWELFKCSLPLPVYKDRNHPYAIDEDELAFLFCQSVREPYSRRFVVEKNQKNNDFRTPNLELILGDDDLVNIKENQITYEFNITKSIYSFGNLNEKIRMGQLKCSSEIVVDLFASIGYYTIPLLIHSSALHVYACEENEESIKALRKNLKANKIEPRKYTVIEGDNKVNKPLDVAHRVILGILPSSYEWLTTAYECIDKKRGAILHCHELLECKPPMSSSSEDASMATASSCGDDSVAMSTTTNDQDEVNDSKSDARIEPNKEKEGDEATTIGETNIKEGDSKTGDDNAAVPDNQSPTGSDGRKSGDSPPVLLEYLAEEQQAKINFSSESSSSNSTSSGSTTSSQLLALAAAKEDKGTKDFLKVGDFELDAYKSRGNQFVDFLDVLTISRNHDLFVRLVDTHVIRAFSTYRHHVVFDIEIKPADSSVESNADEEE